MFIKPPSIKATWLLGKKVEIFGERINPGFLFYENHTDHFMRARQRIINYLKRH